MGSMSLDWYGLDSRQQRQAPSTISAQRRTHLDEWAGWVVGDIRFGECAQLGQVRPTGRTVSKLIDFTATGPAFP